MLVFRTLLLLLVGSQAVGGGMFGLLNTCRMQAETTAERRECHCPHSEQAQTDGPALRADCCGMSHGLHDLPPAVVDTQRLTFLPALAVEAPGWNLAPADASALTELYLRDVPLSQGPPLFLKIRTILI